jgi:hypothetical protein
VTAPPRLPVLVGVDDDALLTVRVGTVEARLRGLPLHLVCAFDAPPPQVVPEALAGWPAKYPDVDIERRAVHGPDVEHGMAALTRDASMVVVAARSLLETGERVLGPITTGPLRDSECPVVVIPAADPVFTG